MCFGPPKKPQFPVLSSVPTAGIPYQPSSPQNGRKTTSLPNYKKVCFTFSECLKCLQKCVYILLVVFSG